MEISEPTIPIPPKQVLIRQIRTTIEKFAPFKAIVSFKGLPIEIVSAALEEKGSFLEKDFFQNGKLNIEKLASKEGRRLLNTSLTFDQDHTRFITYEALIYGHGLLKDMIEDDIFILDFSLSPYHYAGIVNDLPLIEDLNEEGKKVEETAVTALFASVIQIGSKKYVQYRDQELLEAAAKVEFAFPPEPWNYENLPVLLDDNKKDEDFHYNFESRDYIKELDEIIQQEKEAKIRINIDSSIKTSSSAKEQLGRIISFFKAVDIEYELYKVKHDLALSARPELQKTLKEVWGYEGFRPVKIYADPEISKETMEISQATIIETIVDEYEKAASGKDFDDVFVTAPTGAGKSIMFQLPAIYLGSKFGAISIVVTPLISLMEDQVENLKKTGFHKVAYINSSINIIQREEIYERIKNGDIDLIYLAPELLLSYDISHFLQGRKLGLYIVDEAHTVTTWGRDFRVDYWYLGPHIQKIRKYYRDSENNEIKFPVVAFTATAPYDGIHDVVFETLNSLKIVSAKKFIGYVKRENIKFDINHVQLEGNLETQKANLTVERLKAFTRDNKKTIVYCPFKKHVNEIFRIASSEDVPINRYHGGLLPQEKTEAQEQFRDCKIGNLVATKAFGMGVDIPDIDQIYHFAPTGLLTDYVQEIGRAARKKEIEGKAIVDYSVRDFQFINRLHGLNRTYNWQLQEMMKRILRFYDSNGRQNQLVSAEDFDYIFNQDNDNDLQQAVKSALMLLEKDLNKKSGHIPVLIARPKNLFATVFASLPSDQLIELQNKVPAKSIKEIDYPHFKDKGRTVVKMKLNLIWESNFSDKTFGTIKKDFFKRNLFTQLDLRPKLKIDLSIKNSKAQILDDLKENFKVLQIAFHNLQGRFFDKNELYIQLRTLNKSPEWSRRVADFILPLFSQTNFAPGHLTGDDVRQKFNFLQSRTNKEKGESEYRVVDGALAHVRSSTRRKVSDCFQGSTTITRYLDADGPEKLLVIKVGQILEILELGDYAVNGGENPKIFLRINDPFRLRIQAHGHYHNDILENIRERNVSGVELMREFFESELTSEERWNFIEDFFLGRKQ